MLLPFPHLTLAEVDEFEALVSAKYILTPAENARLADLGRRRYIPAPSNGGGKAA